MSKDRLILRHLNYQIKDLIVDNAKKDVYYVLFCSLMMIFIIIFIICMILTQGQSFRDMLFKDNLDIFMDHFNMVYEALDDPYSKHNVLYPPLMEYVFYLIGNITIPYTGDIESIMTPARETRNWTMPMIVFTVMLILLVIMYYIVALRMTCSKMTRNRFDLLFVLVLFSYPVLYGIERGNCIFVCVLFLLLFLYGYKSDRLWIRIISYCCLGVATGVKVFPALFAIFVLKKCGIKESVLCAVIVCIFLFVPFLAFDADIGHWIEHAFEFVNRKASTLAPINLNDFLSSLGISGNPVVIISLIFIGCILAMILFDSNLKEWEQVFLLSTVVVMAFSVSTAYLLVYMLIPLIYFLKENEAFNFYNTVALCCFVVIFALMPAFEQGQGYLLTIKSIAMVTLFLCIICRRAYGPLKRRIMPIIERS